MAKRLLYRTVAPYRFNKRGIQIVFRCVSTLRTKTIVPDDCVIDFDSTQRFFEAKKISEIIRSIAILKLSSYDVFVKNSQSLMNLGQKLLGQSAFERLMKKTMYSQFVAGELYEDIQESIAHLQQHGIGTILYVPTEDDYVEDSDNFENKEAMFDMNTNSIHKCINQTKSGAFAQMRISAICSPTLLTHLSNLIKPYEAKVEKPTGLDLKNLKKGFDTDRYHLELVPGLSTNKNRHLQNSLRRLDALAKHSKEKNVRLLIDAEMSNVEGAMHHMVLVLQKKYNQSAYPLVYGTYQAYRKDTLDRLNSDLNLMSNEGFHFAAKLVRGAYKDKERSKAKEQGYDDPIHDTYHDTCTSYNKCMDIIIKQAAQTPAKLVVASHNEESIMMATKRMANLGIGKGAGKVMFAQIYGMADQVSYLLGAKGYEIYKSVPYGPVNTTLPYLSRRAAENKDVMHRTKKERNLMWKELGYRLFPTQHYDSSKSEHSIK